jgi:hypothetical protein
VKRFFDFIVEAKDFGDGSQECDLGKITMRSELSSITQVFRIPKAKGECLVKFDSYDNLMKVYNPYKCVVDAWEEFYKDLVDDEEEDSEFCPFCGPNAKLDSDGRCPECHCSQETEDDKE